ncbi:MAG: hypothetical protein LBP63_07330, partial [Prevotellaceae bacterium]|jgi:hypothetical protein|nr:hypothetical protein [Prevotellaceae bacterium]
LLGNVRNAGKEWHRHRVNSLLEKAAQMAIEGDVKEATALAKIAMALIKNNKLDMDEGEELPYDEIVPPAFEPSFIPKSGKKTYGLDSSWAGCAKKVKCGLEICGFAAVDVFKNTAFHLNAIQTPPLKNMSLLEYYCQIIK